MTQPALAHSPLVRATEKTLAYIAENGSIGLTPSKAFKRNFVHWAATEFVWPDYTVEDLFKLNKVLNESDFPPLLVLHDLLIHLRIGRHYRGAFRLTKAGEELTNKPGKIFGILVPFFLSLRSITPITVALRISYSATGKPSSTCSTLKQRMACQELNTRSFCMATSQIS